MIMQLTVVLRLTELDIGDNHASPTSAQTYSTPSCCLTDVIEMQSAGCQNMLTSEIYWQENVKALFTRRISNDRTNTLMNSHVYN